jgi:hypothetical protein
VDRGRTSPLAPPVRPERSAVAEASPGAPDTRAQPLRYRVAFFVTALVALGIIVTLPFSVKSVVDDILGPSTGRVIQIRPHGLYPPEANHTKLHLAVIAIDEVQLTATLRVAGHHQCPGCTWKNRVLLVALAGDDADANGLPPSAAIELAPSAVEVSQIVQLPVRGHPIHYPFDRYRLALGIAYQRAHADGALETLTADQARGRLFLSLQELLPRNAMVGPSPLEPRLVQSADDPFKYVDAFEVMFVRPPYLRVLAIMLVILIASAAAYSVFLRPLPDLVVNSGALVLGVWGIRNILTPSSLNYITAVDLALSMVIIFVLGALTIRSLLYVHDKAQMTLLRGRGGQRARPRS